jgi:hypothetical protein
LIAVEIFDHQGLYDDDDNHDDTDHQELYDETEDQQERLPSPFPNFASVSLATATVMATAGVICGAYIMFAAIILYDLSAASSVNRLEFLLVGHRSNVSDPPRAKQYQRTAQMNSVLLDVVVALFPQHVPGHVRSLLDDRNRPTASCVPFLERIDIVPRDAVQLYHQLIWIRWKETRRYHRHHG